MIASVLCAILFLSPATSPSTQPADEIAQLRRMVDDLMREVERLKAENADLRERANANTLFPSNATVKVGMGVPELENIFDQKAQLRSDDGRVKIYDFTVVSQIAHRVLENGPPDDHGHTSYRVRCEFEAGKLARYSISPAYSGGARSR
jgi:hypothetical protein